MNDFRQALTTVIAELTPQPWDYTDGAGATLTVIPAGLREEPGCAEVMVRVTKNKTIAAEVGIASADMPGLIAALKDRAAWEHVTTLADVIVLAGDSLGGFRLTVIEVHWVDDGREETTAHVYLPEAQRLPLVSALRRATDVARGWED